MKAVIPMRGARQSHKSRFNRISVLWIQKKCQHLGLSGVQAVGDLSRPWMVGDAAAIHFPVARPGYCEVAMKEGKEKNVN